MKAEDAGYLWELSSGRSGGAYARSTRNGLVIASRSERKSLGRLPDGIYPTRWELCDIEWHRMEAAWRRAWASQAARHRQSGYSYWKGGWVSEPAEKPAGQDLVLSLVKARWQVATASEDTGAGIFLGWRDDRSGSQRGWAATVPLGLSVTAKATTTPACNPGGLPIPFCCHCGSFTFQVLYGAGEPPAPEGFQLDWLGADDCTNCVLTMHLGIRWDMEEWFYYDAGGNSCGGPLIVGLPSFGWNNWGCWVTVVHIWPAPVIVCERAAFGSL